MSTKLTVSIGQATSKGRKAINQDFLDIRIPNEPQLTHKGIVAALADGISSSDVSQEASKISVNSFLSDYFSTPETWSVKKSAQRVLSASNSWLHTQSKSSQYHYDMNRGYVCTFSALILRSSTAHLLYVGDTRIYRLRGNKLEQLSEDHRLYVSSQKSYLARALGMDRELNSDYRKLSIEVGDIFLLMTDGIHEFVSDDAMIYSIHQHHDDLQVAADEILQKAYANESDDNLSIQLLRVDTLPPKQMDELHSQLADKPFPPLLEERMIFDGYTIIDKISSSNRSHVYRAVDNENLSNVVLKLPSIDMRDDQAYLERFMMEEWISIRINSAHVAKSYLPTRQRNYLYTVTEFIEGQTLAQWMIDNPKPTLETVRQITEQIAKGLQAFHRHEMIHQDLRPENIMIDTAGTVKLIDFGSTRVEGILDINTFIEQENLLGTALYSAPEYFLGRVGTTQSDLYSLGAIVYQMLSGKLPYGVEVARCNTQRAQKKLRYAHLDPEEDGVPLWVNEALKKALQVDPFDRYEELSEFLYDLRHPNRAFVTRNRAPFVERHPVVVWKGISFILLMVIFFLLAYQ